MTDEQSHILDLCALAQVVAMNADATEVEKRALSRLAEIVGRETIDAVNRRNGQSEPR